MTANAFSAGFHRMAHRVSAHFADVYDASVSKDTASSITDRVIDEMQS